MAPPDKKTVDNPPTTVAKLVVDAGGPMTVVIDPGHGDIHNSDGKSVDGGCNTTIDGVLYQEKDIALGVSFAIQKKLTGQPHVKDVFLTREGDNTAKVVRFQWRKDIAQEKKANIFVSVHVNSAESTAPKGHVVYYFPGPIKAKSEKLASKIDSKLVSIAARSSGGCKPESLHMELVKFGGSYPVEAAVLVETGFLRNAEDQAILLGKQTEIGEEIAAGILEYIEAVVAAAAAATATSDSKDSK